MRADFIRYVLTFLEGGVYSDTDTAPVRPLLEWVPEEFRNKTRLIVGVEADSQPPVPGTKYPVQLGQWTFAAAKGQPVLWRMIQRVLNEVAERLRAEKALEKTQPERHLGPNTVDFSDSDVLTVSGPIGWTEEICGYLSEMTQSDFTWENLTDIRRPRMFADVLVLPIDGFATGVPHSGASITQGNETKVMHYFTASWKGGQMEDIC
ncbi:initiation-specific alpha-mannosyltransferase [Colletotrichum sojae]|uniref:Initiation-specific alpha-mannosyltransferase n=1 Tax=Colletotrichum sojae TaxID=2175907 RepID=A0A8H6IRW0_9PEZI|nr:initiation-specific alpha-mannosyltransferase [Colletotrichum sojae]